MPSTIRQSAAGSCSTLRPAAINAIALSEEKRDVTTLTENDFHNIGIGIIRHNVVALARQAGQLIDPGHAEAVDQAAVATDFSALGRFLITKKESDIAAFKTPDIRNILVTGPYFHDGSQETLWGAINHYNKGDGLQARISTKTSSPWPNGARDR